MVADSDSILAVSSVLQAMTELSSPNETVRNAAIEQLIATGQPIIEPLITALSTDDTRTHEAIVSVLVGIGKPANMSLHKALQHEDRRVFEGATQALKRTKDAEIVAALRQQLREELGKLSKYRCQRFRNKLLQGAQTLVTTLPDWLFWILWGVFVRPIGAGSAVERAQAIKGLAYADDVSMIGTIAACLFDEDGAVCAEAANALKRLLPQVKASDKRHIQPEEMNALLKALDGHDDALRVAILKALEQIGDAKAIPHVERIIAGPVTPPVRRAAEECLPYLRLRAEQEQQAQTLLRASTAVEVAMPETLLRPAQGAVSSDTSQLLRPL